MLEADNCGFLSGLVVLLVQWQSWKAVFSHPTTCDSPSTAESSECAQDCRNSGCVNKHCKEAYGAVWIKCAVDIC